MSFSRASRIQQEQPSMVTKIVFVGDSGVGKTSLINRESTDTFVKEHLATIGVDFRIKNYDLGLVQVKAQLWDTAGQERFRSIQKPYYRNAKAVCLCFSLNDRQSFNNLPHWIDELRKFDVPMESIILIGCKSDLDMEVATDQILVFADKEGIPYHQTSAKLSEGVNEAFQSLIISCAQKEIKNQGENKKKEEINLPLNSCVPQGKIKKGCC